MSGTTDVVAAGAAPVVPTEDNQPIQIKPLKIVLQTNVKGKEIIEVTHSMFTDSAHPEKAEYKYPFFTDSVKYPVSIGQTKETCLEFFFNKRKFEETLRKDMTNYVDSNSLLGNPLMDDEKKTVDIQKQMAENGEYNIMMMLRCLFKISDTFGKVLSSSFRQQIKSEFNPEIFSFDIKSLFMGNTEEATIKIQGKEYLVGDLIWLNDIVNHPIYRKFLEEYNEKLKERGSYVYKAKHNYYQKIKKLMIDLYKYTYTSNSNISKEAKFVNELSSQNVKKDKKKDGVPPLNQDIFVQKSKEISNQTTTITSLILKLSDKVNSRIDENGKLKPIQSKDPKKSEDEINEINKYLNEVMDAYIGVHMFIRTYNEQKDSYGGINIKSDTWRDFSNIYLAMIAVKSAKIVMDFVEGRIQKFDLKEKYNDGTSKSGEELDIIQEIKNKYGQYVEMSESIIKSIEQVTEPVRVTIMPELEKSILKLKEPVTSNKDEIDKFRDIYLKIYENVVNKVIYPEVMYTGVNTVSTNKNPMNEIYLYINVVDKKKYLETKLKCQLKNEMVANDILNAMNRKNTYLVNPYRLYGDFEAAKPPNMPVPSNKLVKKTKTKNIQKGGGIRMTKKRRYKK